MYMQVYVYAGIYIVAESWSNVGDRFYRTINTAHKVQQLHCQCMRYSFMFDSDSNDSV